MPPKFDHEVTYPNALDSTTTKAAANFTLQNSSPSTNLPTTPSAWKSAFAPTVPSWTDWALIQATLPDTSHVIGQCVVTKWPLPGGANDTTAQDQQEDPQLRPAILFITQLLVHPEHRGQGCAAGMLRVAQEEKVLMAGVSAVGTASGHTGAVRAVASVFGGKEESSAAALEGIRTQDRVLRTGVREVLEASPVPFLREARVLGGFVGGEEIEGVASAVKTGWRVDSGLAEEGLEKAKRELGDRGWWLGDRLPDDGEWLLMFKI